MIGIKPRVGLTYFNRNIIRQRWRRLNNDPLGHAGAIVMKIARQSIKRRATRRGKPSPVGTPPRSRKPGALPPFKQIFYQRTGKGVIVGMVGYNAGIDAVPGLHEHSGWARRKVWIKQPRQRRVRGARRGQFRKVSYKYQTKTVKYPKRPFMVPALLQARAKLPYLWRNSLRQ